MSLLDTFLATADRCGDKSAIIDGQDRMVSFIDLARWSSDLAADWRMRGIGKGDRVLVAMPLGHGLYASLAALWRLGAVAVFPEPAMGLTGLRHAAGTTEPKAYLSAGWMARLAYVVPELWRIGLRLNPSATRDWARSGDGIRETLDADDPALISFTSGSTGTPKAIERSHGFLLSQHRAVAPMLRTDRTDAIDLVAFPIFVLVDLALGITSALPCWRVTQHDRADMGNLDAFIRRNGITRALVPPSTCELMVGTPMPRRLSALMTGGGPVFPDLLHRLIRSNPDLAIEVVYGSTEAEPISHLAITDIADADWRAMQAGAGLLAGHPVPQMRLCLMEDEIIVTGEHVNKGYMDAARNAVTKIAREGEIWHRTGDAGRIDANGRLWLLGRLDGRAGQHYPFCVEGAARFWPGVRRAALVGTGNGAALAIEGDTGYEHTWRTRAGEIGIDRVVPMSRIPLDLRHASKVDYRKLAKAIR
jgi:olefin beta-lactone synthetase